VTGWIYEDEVTKECRNMHNDELHKFYSSLSITDNQIKKDKIGWACSIHGADEKCVQVRFEASRERIFGTECFCDINI
jgi:hypothetical protein